MLGHREEYPLELQKRVGCIYEEQMLRNGLGMGKVGIEPEVLIAG